MKATFVEKPICGALRKSVFGHAEEATQSLTELCTRLLVIFIGAAVGVQASSDDRELRHCKRAVLSI